MLFLLSFPRGAAFVLGLACWHRHVLVLWPTLPTISCPWQHVLWCPPYAPNLSTFAGMCTCIVPESSLFVASQMDPDPPRAPLATFVERITLQSHMVWIATLSIITHGALLKVIHTQMG